METLQVHKLDPTSICASRWANRHESAFSCRAYLAFKAEIEAAGGNVQPIKVRPASAARYEVVFGHRRWRACLELGLPVLAIVVALDDRALWEEMERENRSRADLSPFEQGKHYSRAIDSGLFPSIRRLAEAVGVDHSQAAKVIRLAQLPADVVAAFVSPNDIQVNWSGPLHEAINRDPAGVVARAKRLGKAKQLTAKATFDELVRRSGVESFHANSLVISDPEHREVAVIRRSAAGYTVQINGFDLPVAKLEAALKKLLLE